MRTIIGATIVALSLVSCSSAPTQPTAATVTVTASPAHSTKDAAFLAAVRATVKGASDADLIYQAQGACNRINAGTNPLDVAADLMNHGYTSDDAAAIVTAAQQVYCP